MFLAVSFLSANFFVDEFFKSSIRLRIYSFLIFYLPSKNFKSFSLDLVAKFSFKRSISIIIELIEYFRLSVSLAWILIWSLKAFSSTNFDVSMNLFVLFVLFIFIFSCPFSLRLMIFKDKVSTLFLIQLISSTIFLSSNNIINCSLINSIWLLAWSKD